MTPVALIVVALAGASLFLPWDPVYDPWGWLVWGREVAGLELDTSSGPSWKPLPVIFTTPFSLLGEGAPALWLLVARMGWLAAVALAALLAVRVAERAGGGRPERAAAATLAAIGIVLLLDPLTPWLRQFAGGLTEPLLLALALAAVERGLAGREVASLVLVTLAALIRPEAWPFLLVYSVWVWRRRPERRVMVAVAVGAVAALWFVPDLLGSGSFLTGADRAREGSGSPPVEALEVLWRAAELPVAVLWVGFAVTLYRARGRGDGPLAAVGWGALAWIALVAVMAAAGYAGLPRFLAPAAGIVCAFGGAGLAGIFGAAAGARGARHLWHRFAAMAVGLLLVVQVGFRVAELPGDAASASRISDARQELADVVEGYGAERMRRCGPIVVGAIEGQTAFAWLLDVPIAAIDVSKTPPTPGVFLERTDGGWRAHAEACPDG